MSQIKDIRSRQILDSRGNPTVETAVILDSGVIGAAAVPSGASKGKHEAVELRDGGKPFGGMGVEKAVGVVNGTLKPLLVGRPPSDQEDIDRLMMAEDGTPNKSRFGANAILSVSLALAKAGAADQKRPLYAYLADLAGSAERIGIGVPLSNILNGGLHGGGSFEFQEFMVVPDKRFPYPEAIRVIVELYHVLKSRLKENGMSYLVGDEGGFSPEISSNRSVLEFLKETVFAAGMAFGNDIRIAVDLASGSFYRDGKYRVSEKHQPLDREVFAGYLKELADEFNIISYEDPLEEEDWEGWSALTANLGGKMMIVGDDLLVTNRARLDRAIAEKACNAVLVKVNQIGTLTETLDVVKTAWENGLKVIVSHRSGETCDDFIADLAVAVGADYVKFGAPARGERVAKYNRLWQIYQEISIK